MSFLNPLKWLNHDDMFVAGMSRVYLILAIAFIVMWATGAFDIPMYNLDPGDPPGLPHEPRVIY